MDLSQLNRDGATIDLGGGRRARLRIEPDEGYNPFAEVDTYGQIAALDSGPRTGYGYRERPADFDGNAEKLSGSDGWWWQPPADGPRRGGDHFRKLRSLVLDLIEYGCQVVTLEALEGEDAYHRPIVTACASLGGIDSLEDGYLAEVVSQLATELGLQA